MKKSTIYDTHITITMHQQPTFLEHVGNSLHMRVVQHFIEGREFEYTLTDLLEAGVSWATVNAVVPRLESVGIIRKTRTVGRATLYTINKKNIVAQHLIRLYDAVLRNHT